MPEKFLVLRTDGQISERAGTDQSTGATDAGKIVALDNTGKLHLSLFPTGIGPQLVTLQAAEALNAGDFVNIFNAGGVAKVRKAEAIVGKEAHGFVLNSATAGSNIDVYFSDENTLLSGLTPGAIYFLSTVPGQVTTTRPTGANAIVQKVGVATSTTSLFFQPSQPIVLID